MCLGPTRIQSHGAVQYGADAEIVDCVFDKAFIGGSTLGGLVPEGMGSRVKKAHLVNRTYGLRRHAGYYARTAANTHVEAFRHPHNIGYSGPRPARGSGPRPPYRQNQYVAMPVPAPQPQPQPRPQLQPRPRPPAHAHAHGHGHAAPRPNAAAAQPPPRPVRTAPHPTPPHPEAGLFHCRAALT
jgi:hypothetical protein